MLTDLPPGFDLAAYRDHAERFFSRWLRDLRWNGVELADLVVSLTARVTRDEQSTEPVLLAGGGRGIEIHREPSLRWEGMVESVFDPGWSDAVESFALTGSTLHPDTLLEVDPIAWATNRASLYIGVADRSDPDGPLKYDATRQSWSNDVGVVMFPLRTAGRVPSLVSDGVPHHDAGAIAVILAAAEAGAHESLETFQRVYGEPVWDPHESNGYRLEIQLDLGGIRLEGSAH